MADPIHLQELQRGVKAWNRWREENPGITPDLSRTDRTHAYLSHANLSHVDMRGMNLVSANLVGADFAGADLSGANLLGVIGLVQKQLDSALGDEATRIPPGFLRPASWTRPAADQRAGG